MKKTFAAFLLVAALGLSASAIEKISGLPAKCERVATFQIADTASLVQGISKLGEMTGNAMIGMMASQAIAQNPYAEMLDAPREGAGMTFVLFMENGNFDTAILYPVSVTKAQFLKSCEGAVESNGLIKAESSFVAFSKDGKWAAVGDNPRRARAALKETAIAEKKIDGDLVRIRVDNIRAIKDQVSDFLSFCGDEKQKAQTDKLREQIDSIVGVVAALKVGDKGLDFRMSFKVSEGSAFDKTGKTPLAPGYFSFAGPDAIMAQAVAKNVGAEYFDSADLVKVLAKHGIDISSFYDDKGSEDDKNIGRVVIDVPALVKYFKQFDAGKVDGEKLLEDIGKIKKDGESNPEMKCSYALKGHKPIASVEERFALTMPEAKGKSVIGASFLSLGSIVKVVMPAVLAQADKNVKQQLSPLVAMLPPEAKGGTAHIIWRDGATFKMIVRISPDEFKALSPLMAGAMTLGSAMHAAPSAGDDEEDK